MQQAPQYPTKQITSFAQTGFVLIQDIGANLHTLRLGKSSESTMAVRRDFSEL
ncbi:hypothetical protein [Limnohabitans sp. Rim8]|jgi:hypothetical protein|uniref:hypothetical protein n=1 Tax=Limnohabitans sp. Rim8 TaxID=1100718 RepID=UPI001304AB33|nr:hypothetical protein [Limnohabitans sp. Rim8]